MRLRLLLALLWLGVMAGLASIPGPDDPSSGAIANAVHAVQYAVFTIIVFSLARAALPRLPGRVLLVPILGLALLVGAGQEWYQSLLPYRSADPVDVLFDAAGAAAGLALGTAASALWQRRPQRQLLAG
ncbi:MAG: hypothetical protein F4081_03675 [Dehalococcoidia bacterium]|nr:hypothetical protein [Dehalococcoidia bacterium]MYI85890.1 hypothetical protein [Dehalococcoidia bacterium]